MSEQKHDSIKKCLHYHLKKYFELHSSSSEPSNLYHQIISEVEKVLITETMDYCDDVQAKATKILGINRGTLSKKLKEMGK